MAAKLHESTDTAAFISRDIGIHEWNFKEACSTSYGVCISHLIRFAKVSSHVVDFNARNKSLTAKLLQQGYRYHKL